LAHFYIMKKLFIFVIITFIVIKNLY
jgi:hypothetical protein